MLVNRVVLDYNEPSPDGRREGPPVKAASLRAALRLNDGDINEGAVWLLNEGIPPALATATSPARTPPESVATVAASVPASAPPAASSPRRPDSPLSRVCVPHTRGCPLRSSSPACSPATFSQDLTGSPLSAAASTDAEPAPPAASSTSVTPSSDTFLFSSASPESTDKQGGLEAAVAPPNHLAARPKVSKLESEGEEVASQPDRSSAEGELGQVSESEREDANALRSRLRAKEVELVQLQAELACKAKALEDKEEEVARLSEALKAGGGQPGVRLTELVHDLAEKGSLLCEWEKEIRRLQLKLQGQADAKRAAAVPATVAGTPASSVLDEEQEESSRQDEEVASLKAALEEEKSNLHRVSASMQGEVEQAQQMEEDNRRLRCMYKDALLELEEAMAVVAKEAARAEEAEKALRQLQGEFAQVNSMCAQLKELAEREPSPSLSCTQSKTLAAAAIQGACMPEGVKCFGLMDLQAATLGWEEARVVGSGTCGKGRPGKMYSGVLQGEESETARGLHVAVLRPDIWDAEYEILTDVACLGKLRHPNVVRLVGHCAEDRESLLVFEHCHRQLHDMLFSEDEGCLFTWEQRVKVARDIAQGLAFLHLSNISYENCFEPSKIYLESQSGGNAKLLAQGCIEHKPADCLHAQAQDMSSDDGPPSAITLTKFCGPYEDSAYPHLLHLQGPGRTRKSDVYTFGVILLELISGVPAEAGGTAWALPLINDQKRDMWALFDSRLIGSFSDTLAETIAEQCLEIALLAKQCVDDDPSSRPEARDLADCLRGIARK